LNSILDLDARLSSQMRVAEKPGALRVIAVFFAHSGDSWFWAIGLLALWTVSYTHNRSHENGAYLVLRLML
jgi:hypothetical protein